MSVGVAASMRAVVLAGPGQLELRELPTPHPGPGEALVQVRACGICGSDLHFYRAELPARHGNPMGHEFSGSIAALGDGVPGWGLGQAVVVEPLWTCRQCDYCLRGEHQLCLRRRLMGTLVPGGMAEYALVPAYGLHTLAPGLDFALGALVEPLAVAVHGLHLALLQPGEQVLVLGGGSIGLLTALAARALGAKRVVVSCRHHHQAAAAYTLGVHEAILLEHGQAALAAAARAPFDIVVDAVGGAETAQQALTLVRPGGRVLLLGITPQALTFGGLSLTMKEIRIIASSSYCAGAGGSDFQRAEEIMLAHAAQAHALITHEYSLEEALTAFGAALDKGSGSIKVQLAP